MEIRVARPLVQISGQNLQILHQKVDRFHVSESGVAVCRKIVRPMIRRWRKKYKDRWRDCYPPAVRRGLVLAVLERHRQNFKLYADVMSGRVGG